MAEVDQYGRTLALPPQGDSGAAPPEQIPVEDQFIDFQIPEGPAGTEGQLLNLELPSGRMAVWTVPTGVVPGQWCRLPLPEDELGGQPVAKSGLAAEAEREREERYRKVQHDKQISGGFTVGDVVKTWQAEKGIVQYIGPVAGQAPEKIWLGIEWLPGASRCKNDGSTGGERFFTCAGGASLGSFVAIKSKDKVLDNRFNQYLEGVGAAVSTITSGR